MGYDRGSYLKLYNIISIRNVLYIPLKMVNNRNTDFVNV